MTFEDLPGPKTHAERVTSLRGLSPNALGQMVEDCATGEKAEWLNTMLDCGLFEIENLGKEHGYAPTALDFLKRSALKMSKVDPEYGALDRPSFNLQLNAEPSTIAFFERFVDHILRQKPPYATVDDPHNPMEPGEIDYEISELFAKTMVAASALKRPDLMQRLVDASPSSADIHLPRKILGSATSGFMEDNETSFTPYVFAMQLSDTEGMEILKQSGTPLQSVAMIRKKMGAFDVPHAIDVFEAAGSICATLCVPSAFAKALRDRMEAEDPPQGAVLDRHIERMLSGGQGQRTVGPCLVALEKEGILNLSPTHSARMACIHGHAELIPNLVDIEWKPEPEDIESQPAWQAIDRVYQNAAATASSVSDAAMKKAQASIAAYWNRAIADGHPEVVNQVEISCDDDVLSPNSKPDVSIEPVQRLITLGFNAPLLAMLNAGLSPTARMKEGLPSPLEMAIESAKQPNNDGSTEILLRSFAARGLAHSLIDDMGATPFTPRP